jgi:shikimate dehydrogenase
VPAADIARVLGGLRGIKNFRGSIVTMPHKAAVIPLLDEVTSMVKLVGACNIIKKENDGRLTGENLDGEGFVAGLRAGGFEVPGKTVYLAGAGGAASAISFALAKHGAAALTIVNRTANKAEELAARVQAAFPGTEVRAGIGADRRFDIVVNATSVGLRETDPSPIPESIVKKASYAADIIAARPTTQFLEIARAAGIPYQNGIPMIEAQSNIILDMFGAVKSEQGAP